MRMTWNSVLYRWWQLYYFLEEVVTTVKWWLTDGLIGEACPCCGAIVPLRDMVDLVEQEGVYTRLCKECFRLACSGLEALDKESDL
jgi:hypothetical protein